METLVAIATRHSIPKVKHDPVPEAIITRLLTAGVQAPNHHRVRPWRFVVLTGAGRSRLGDVMAEAKKQRDPDSAPEVLEVERTRPLRAPLIIAIGVDQPADPKVVEVENICAAAAAAQNILLAAHDLGLAAMWRTGAVASDPLIKLFLGFQADQHVIGFLYIGYPEDGDRVYQDRPAYEDRTTWMTE